LLKISNTTVPQSSEAINTILQDKLPTCIPQLAEAPSLMPSTEPTFEVEDVPQVLQGIAKLTAIINEHIVRSKQ
jgi:hypothetical protein